MEPARRGGRRRRRQRADGRDGRDRHRRGGVGGGPLPELESRARGDGGRPVLLQRDSDEGGLCAKSAIAAG
eukprot:SAG11_NODE_568_length_8478_cov_24.289891_7_plen_71_part_00